jgi:hypothetical protein
MSDRIFALVASIALAGAALLSSSAPAHAAEADQRCFPETGQCLNGRFLEYWEQHGGLAIFGYPITEARAEVNQNMQIAYSTQWFERARFELHPANRAA